MEIIVNLIAFTTTDQGLIVKCKADTCEYPKDIKKGCHGFPDWIVEIVSPGSKQMDYYKKLFQYRMAGVREYWIIDQEKETVMAYRFEKETMDQYSFEEDISVGIYEGVPIRIS